MALCDIPGGVTPAAAARCLPRPGSALTAEGTEQAPPPGPGSAPPRPAQPRSRARARARPASPRRRRGSRPRPQNKAHVPGVRACPGCSRPLPCPGRRRLECAPRGGGAGPDRARYSRALWCWPGSGSLSRARPQCTHRGAILAALRVLFRFAPSTEPGGGPRKAGSSVAKTLRQNITLFVDFNKGACIPWL